MAEIDRREFLKRFAVGGVGVTLLPLPALAQTHL
jgi:hypothetical protein